MSGPFGVTLTGFNRKRFADIILSLGIKQAPIFGVDPASAVAGNWPTPADQMGQLNPTFAQELADAWDAFEIVWQSGDPGQAVGASLDLLLAQNLIKRLAAAATTVQAAMTGTEGTLVPAGTKLSESATGDIFVAQVDATIARAAAIKVTLGIGAVVNSTTYITTINGTPHPFTSDSSATDAEIVTGLVAALAGIAAISVVNNGITYTIAAADLTTAFSFDIDVRQVVNTLASPQAFAAQSTGPVQCVTGALDTIVTPVSGLTSVTNYLDGILGRNLETDRQARLRRLLTVMRGGKGTVSSIRAKLLSGDVKGVTAAFILENITDNTDANGLPPHSISAVVVGGTDAAVAKAILETRADGIATYGNENADGTQAVGQGTGIVVVDAQGFNQTVHFSRPVKKYAWVKAVIHKYSEETFPDGGAALVAAALLAYGETFTVGEDFLLQRFYGPCFTIPGIASVDITIAITTTPTGTPTYGSADLAVGPAAVAVFDSARIPVTVA